MFSPLNDPQVEDWFQRLNAAWKRMPADEQVRQREEVRQHLEGLVAAKVANGQPPEDAWIAALTQFGDPEQIGRKLYREWRQSKVGFGADMAAIGFGCGLEAIRLIPDQLFSQSVASHLPFSFWLMFSGPATALIGIAIGRRYPVQALKSALFWPLLWTVILWTRVAVSVSFSNGRTRLPDGDALHFVALNMLSYEMPTILLSCVAAYLASVTKRGWYKPTLNDFKLTLPKRGRVAR